MTKNTKRVDELEVGDIVMFPNCKGIHTVSKIDILSEWDYLVSSVGIDTPKRYDSCVEVTYLGNNREEKIMEAKVECSALYPYFDLLIKEEATLKHTNIPVYVRQQLKNIHELFEDVLGLTLEEVKTLYFERKMGKQESKVDKKEDDFYVTKKAKELCIADKIVLSGPVKIVEIVELKAIGDSHIQFTWEDSYSIYLKNTLVEVLKE